MRPDCDHLSHADREALLHAIPVPAICRTCEDHMEMSATVTDTTGRAKTLSDPVASSHGPRGSQGVVRGRLDEEQAMTEETEASVLPDDIDSSGPEWSRQSSV